MLATLSKISGSLTKSPNRYCLGTTSKMMCHLLIPSYVRLHSFTKLLCRADGNLCKWLILPSLRVKYSRDIVINLFILYNLVRVFSKEDPSSNIFLHTSMVRAH